MIGEVSISIVAIPFSFLTCYSVYICLRHRKMEPKRCLGWPSRSGRTTGICDVARHGASRSVVPFRRPGSIRVSRNRTERSATFQMIGPDRGGALWTICIVETILRGRWRAVTGWPSEASDKAWYEKQGSGTDMNEDMGADEMFEGRNNL